MPITELRTMEHFKESLLSVIKVRLIQSITVYVLSVGSHETYNTGWQYVG